jgi:hypothetical protein
VTKVVYDGPPDQVNREVGDALRAASETGEASDILEPGVYDLPTELADRLVASNAAWSRVTSYERLSVAELKDIARDLEIEGFSSMTKAQLVEAIRAKESGGEGS